jgi:Amidase
VIIGKAALEEYATSGNYSNDAWGQVWNAFDPSRSAIASSGGSATAVAANLAAGALGSQTGDSLYGPASAASLVTLRGTDGLESGTGVMPLVWLQDFWDDDELVGMAYAFEQRAHGHVATTFAPPLRVISETSGTVGGTVPPTLSLTRSP